jgi:hypothetical protein
MDGVAFALHVRKQPTTMRTAIFSLVSSFLVSLATPSFAGNFFGAGPWANSTYFPGNLDGKYQAAVYAPDGTANISGVLGFAIRNGSTTTVTNSSASTSSGAGGVASATSSTITQNPFDNFFTIFVAGRTYTGITDANINYDNDTVTGALIGVSPPANPPIEIVNVAIPIAEVEVDTQVSLGVATSTTNTNISTIDTSLWDLGALVNRGLSGGFRANINSKKATFTFSGSGELSSASDFIAVDAQSITDSQVVKDADGNPERIIFSPTATARQTIATRPFQLSGIRVAF